MSNIVEMMNEASRQHEGMMQSLDMTLKIACGHSGQEMTPDEYVSRNYGRLFRESIEELEMTPEDIGLTLEVLTLVTRALSFLGNKVVNSTLLSIQESGCSPEVASAASVTAMMMDMDLAALNAALFDLYVEIGK